MMRRRDLLLMRPLQRRRNNVPIRRRGGKPLRCLGDVPLRLRWVFHLRRTCDVVGTYRETSLRRRYDVATTSCCQVGHLLSEQPWKGIKTIILTKNIRATMPNSVEFNNRIITDSTSMSNVFHN